MEGIIRLTRWGAELKSQQNAEYVHDCHRVSVRVSVQFDSDCVPEPHFVANTTAETMGAGVKRAPALL